MDKVWLICEDCGYAICLTNEELMNRFGEKCNLCGGMMFLEQKKEKEEQAPGDNFPLIPDRQQEMLDNFRILGMNYTWYLIEAFTDIKLRLQYREMFFKCGGRIPE
jgi:hypothetical protein